MDLSYQYINIDTLIAHYEMFNSVYICNGDTGKIEPEE